MKRMLLVSEGDVRMNRAPRAREKRRQQKRAGLSFPRHPRGRQRGRGPHQKLHEHGGASPWRAAASAAPPPAGARATWARPGSPARASAGAAARRRQAHAPHGNSGKGHRLRPGQSWQRRRGTGYTSVQNGLCLRQGARGGVLCRRSAAPRLARCAAASTRGAAHRPLAVKMAVHDALVGLVWGDGLAARA